MAEPPPNAVDDERAPAEAAGDPDGEAPVEPEPSPRTPWVTIVLAAANLLVWLVTVALGASIVMPSAQWMFEHGGNAGEVTLDGQQWRLFTSMFLHYGVLHVGMNMLGLFLGGRLVERLYGRLGLATIYLVSGLASSLATALRPGVVSAGASGAIFGVLGALAAFYALHRKRMDQDLAKEASGLVVFGVYSLLGGFGSNSVDIYAHVGGLVAGFACGVAIEAKRDADAPRLTRTIFVALFGLCAVISAVVLAPEPAPR